MRVANDSVVLNETLLPILRWTAQQSGPMACDNMAQLVVRSSGDLFASRLCVVTGEAHPCGGWQRGMRAKHLIDIFIPPELFASARYPRSQSYNSSAPTHRFANWHEELAETVAHELCHVRQFEQGWAPGLVVTDDMVAEVEAEWFGATVLERYRQWQPRWFPQVSRFVPSYAMGVG